MFQLLIDGDAVVGPLIARIVVAGARQLRLADGASPTVDDVLEFVLAKGEVEGGGPHQVAVVIVEGVAVGAPAVESAGDVDHVCGGEGEA